MSEANKLRIRQHSMAVIWLLVAFAIFGVANEVSATAGAYTPFNSELFRRPSCMVRWLTLSRGAASEREAVRIENSFLLLPEPIDESNSNNIAAQDLWLLFGGLGKAQRFLSCINRTDARCRRPAPCQHSGRCLHARSAAPGSTGRGGYACSCSPEYTGAFCQTNASPCSSSPCLNGGSCLAVGTSSYRCSCSTFHSGRNCQRRWFDERRLTQMQDTILSLGGTVDNLRNDADELRHQQGTQAQRFLSNIQDRFGKGIQVLNASVKSQQTQIEDLETAVHRLEFLLDDHSHSSEGVTTATSEAAPVTTSSPIPSASSCRRGLGTSGIFNGRVGGHTYSAYCDRVTDGGGWTVFQRRQDGSVSFNRSWSEYQRGFGSPSGEFWLGLDTLHQLTSQNGVPYELRADMTIRGEARKHFEKHSSIRVAGGSDNYRLTIEGTYNGTLGNSRGTGLQGHRGKVFSTRDRDNIPNPHRDCVTINSGGGWWYSSGCGLVFANGAYGASYPKGITWHHVYSWPSGTHAALSFLEMKIRPLM